MTDPTDPPSLTPLDVPAYDDPPATEFTEVACPNCIGDPGWDRDLDDNKVGCKPCSGTGCIRIRVELDSTAVESNWGPLVNGNANHTPTSTVNEPERSADDDPARVGAARARGAPSMVGPEEDGDLTAFGWEPIDLAAALKRDGPPPPTVLERSDGIPLLYPGRTHAFIGEPESMKSWGWQIAAAQLIKAGQPVLVLDFENDEDAVIERLRALGSTDPEILANLVYIRPSGALDDRVAYLLAQLQTERSFRLAVVDGVTDAMATLGLDPDKNRDAATFDRKLLKPLARTGTAVVAADHVIKNREDRGRYAIGAQHKLAAIDGAVFVFDVLKPFGREREGLARVTLSKDKPGWLRRHATGKTVAELRLTSWPDSNVTGGFDPPKRTNTGEPTIVMEKVSRAIEAEPGIGKRALRSAVGGNSAITDTAVEILANRGFIRIERGPNNGHRHYLERPYREHETDAEEPQDHDLPF